MEDVATRMAKVAAVAFDMDGTLTESVLDFGLIRAECGAEPGTGLLEFLDSAPEPQRSRGHAVLARHEERAARDCVLRDGARQTLGELRRRGLKTALLTRNSARSVCTVLERFGLRFDCCVTREDAAPKPSAEPVLRIARQLGVEPGNIVVVGDYKYDVEAGRAAGAVTAFLKTRGGVEPPVEADLVLERLPDLLDALPRNPAGGRAT